MVKSLKIVIADFFCCLVTDHADPNENISLLNQAKKNYLREAVNPEYAEYCERRIAEVSSLIAYHKARKVVNFDN
jgi:hypothetical protein